MVETLAALHRFDWRAAGLADFGRPDGYIGRQVERWSKQYQLSETEPIPAMDQLTAWLKERIPPDGAATIAHGDYRLGNLIIHPAEARIVAVLDWEISTIGHPLADLAYAAQSYRQPRDGQSYRGLGGLDLAGLGIPSEEEFVAAYCAATGREAIADWPFFVAFSLFRTVSICQGVYARSLQGNAADRTADQYGAIAKRSAELGWQVAQEYR
jgi:aminoglycoside phosphotransferase (APT) family kinase protein